MNREPDTLERRVVRMETKLSSHIERQEKLNIENARHIQELAMCMSSLCQKVIEFHKEFKTFKAEWDEEGACETQD